MSGFFAVIIFSHDTRYKNYAKQIVSPFNIQTIFYNDVDNFVENLDKIPVAVICIPPIIVIDRFHLRTYASDFKKVYDAVYDPINKDVKCPLFVALLIQHFKGQDVSLISESDRIYSNYYHEAIQYTIDRTGEFVEKDRFWNMSTNKIQEITKLPLVRLMYPVIYPVSLLFL